MPLFRFRLLPIALCTIVVAATQVVAAEDDLGADSQEQADVPKGTLQEFPWNGSTVYPGTERKYWIYLPPAFDKAVTYPLIVFQDVDCTTTCGTPGWYELHSVIWDDAAQKALFTIIYLSTDQHAEVELSYSRSLPDLGDPIGDLRLPATWTAQPAAHRPSHMTMPPPRALAL